MDSRDLNRIRDLAKEQLEIAKSPEMESLGKAWTDLNDCKRIKPLVTVETATFANEVIPPLMKCTTEEGRSWEYMLLGNIINHKYFGDDTFVCRSYSEYSSYNEYGGYVYRNVRQA